MNESKNISLMIDRENETAARNKKKNRKSRVAHSETVLKWFDTIRETDKHLNMFYFILSASKNCRLLLWRLCFYMFMSEETSQGFYTWVQVWQDLATEQKLCGSGVVC